MTIMRTTSLVLLGLATGATMAACARESTVPNPNHCANQTGDEWCAARYEDGSRPFCILGNGVCGSTPGRDGCVEARPAEDTCYSPCGASMTVEEDASCLPGGESTSSGESSTAEGMTGTTETGSESSSSTTGPMPCVSDEECTEVEAPFCGVMGECGTCEGTADPDAACAGVDPLLPLCVGGACVQCTAAAPEACTGTTPLCDDATNTCVPCTEHGQCGEAACNLYTGACLPADADAIAHVGPGQEFASLTLAVASIPADSEGTVVVHQANYDEAVTVDANRTLAFLAADGDSPLWILAGGGMPQLTVPMGSTVLMDGLRLSSNANNVGLRVDGGRAWVDRSRIVQNSGGGVLAENGAELTLRNCFVGGDVNVIGLEVLSASATVLYSTVAASTFGTTPALGCTTPIAVDVRNSIVVSQGGTPPDEVDCASASVTTSAIEAAVGFNAGWFTSFDNGDFSLSPAGAMSFADVALWSTGDPLTDIDDDLRPAIDATPDYAGADVP